MQKACTILKQLGTPCLIHQPRYSMFDRWVEDGLIDLLEKEGVGCIVFSPLAQGVLTGRYLNGIPADSRAAGQSIFLKPEGLTTEKLDKVRKLNDLAQQRGQTLAQMALAWVLRGGRVTSALIGASKTEQIDDCVKTVENLAFSKDELDMIEDILKG
jgi:L-glyceraldehyde 3-phosphate reductase